MQDKLSADTLDDLRVNPESGPFTARRERHGYEASMTPREILSVSQTEGLSAVSPNEEDAPDEDDGDLGAAMRVRLKRIERIRTSEGSERLKFVAAISEIVELLSVTHTEVALWLLHLVSALRDLDLGRIDPLFVPNKIDSRPPDATRVWYARAMVAAAAQSPNRPLWDNANRSGGRDSRRVFRTSECRQVEGVATGLNRVMA